MRKIIAWLPALILAAAVLTTAATPAAAMDTPKPDPKDPDKKGSQLEKGSPLEQARAAIEAKDWTGAQAILREAVARNPQNADAQNLYAYSMRKGPNPAMDLVFRHYNEALRIDPNHRGAHEYIAEAYLMTGNLAKAKEHLAQLDRICTLGCAEYAKLKKEIATYEQQHAKQ